MTEWLRVGEWVLSVADIAAVHYEDTPEGPTAEIFTVSGGDEYSTKGEEAERVWAYFCALSSDVMGEEPLHKRVKRGEQR